MKTNTLKHVFAVGLAAMMALGAAGVASAKARARDYVGVWQLDDRQGNSWGQDRNRGYNDRDHGRQGDWGDDRYGSRNDDRYGSRNDSRYGSGGGFRMARLPETFRIERSRRDFRLENMNGQLLRQVDFGRNNQLTSERSIFGAQIYETYTLVDNGRRLLVRTSIRGSQGTRQMTSVYERA